MTLHPSLAAMRRNKVGAVLIGLQIAVTLAILCNSLFIIQQRLGQLARPSGTDETDLFAITNEWIGDRGTEARVSEDLVALRAVPGVAGAYVSNSYPLGGAGRSGYLSKRPFARGVPTVGAVEYFGDEQMLQTLGLRLIAGRNFSATEVANCTPLDEPLPAGLIVTRALARELFPGSSAIGQLVHFDGQAHATPIVGVVAGLQAPYASGGQITVVDDSVLVPCRYVAGIVFYVVRAAPGQLAAVMKAAPRRLQEIDPDRVIRRVQSFSQARAAMYRNDRGLAVILSIVCAVLLAVLALGLAGLTSYWVAQRRRQIGIRRALGATRPAIVRYFQLENFTIALTGGAAGVGLGLAVNLWMVEHLQASRMPLVYLLIGLASVLALGQLAVLWPALLAAAVPPAEATRTV